MFYENVIHACYEYLEAVGYIYDTDSAGHNMSYGEIGEVMKFFEDALFEAAENLSPGDLRGFIMKQLDECDESIRFCWICEDRIAKRLNDMEA